MAAGNNTPGLEPLNWLGRSLEDASRSFGEGIHKYAAKNQAKWRNSPEYRKLMADEKARRDKEIAENRKSGRNAGPIFVERKSGPEVRLPGGKPNVAKKEALKKLGTRGTGARNN
jgi:hypothetical protein